MKKECNQEQEKSKILKVEHTIFKKIIRDYAIEVNTIKKDVKQNKKENKKKKKDSTKLKDENKTYEKKIKVKDVKIEKLQTIEAEADAYIAIATKDECDKEIEREKCKKSVKMLKFNHNQVLKEVKTKIS